jgi:hypothetical protein
MGFFTRGRKERSNKVFSSKSEDEIKRNVSLSSGPLRRRAREESFSIIEEDLHLSAIASAKEKALLMKRGKRTEENLFSLNRSPCF